MNHCKLDGVPTHTVTNATTRKVQIYIEENDSELTSIFHTSMKCPQQYKARAKAKWQNGWITALYNSKTF